jgi:spoIIIJ-associated protein
MEYVEFTGKTVDEAVENGLQALGITKENADIRVLEEGKKKLFGSVKARVEIAVKKQKTEQVVGSGKTDGERAVEFLEGLFELLNVTACTELVSENEKVEINVTTANTKDVIGKHGETLDAIQTLAGAVANTGRDKYKRVVVDCENYRENREETLNKLAGNLAEKALRLGKKIMLEPMNPYERRIIHSALSNREDVKTISEGKEPNRYIVIVPNNVAEGDEEMIPARTERKRERNDRGNGGRNGRNGFGNKRSSGGGFKRSGSTSNSGGTSLKKDNDFFGIFLGNSNKDE